MKKSKNNINKCRLLVNIIIMLNVLQSILPMQFIQDVFAEQYETNENIIHLYKDEAELDKPWVTEINRDRHQHPESTLTIDLGGNKEELSKLYWLDDKDSRQEVKISTDEIAYNNQLNKYDKYISEILEYESNLEKYNTKKVELENQKNQLSTEVTSVEKELQITKTRLEEAINQLNDASDEEESDLGALNTNVKEIELTFDSMTKKLNEIKNSFNQVSKELNELGEPTNPKSAEKDKLWLIAYQDKNKQNIFEFKIPDGAQSTVLHWLTEEPSGEYDDYTVTAKLSYTNQSHKDYQSTVTVPGNRETQEKSKPEENKN